LSSFFSELGRRNVIRVAALYLVSAWLIAQVADVIIGLGELPSSIGRVVLTILAIGFPVALGLAWVFEWTPAGLRREAAPVGGAVNRATHGRQLDFVIIAVLSVALVYFAASHDWQGTQPLAGASIAVLPFENRSSSPDDLYFADGIHDDLLTQLAKISSLTVISRTSVMQYRHTEKTVPQIASELGVATILEGGVQRAGDRVRVNLQLIEAATDRHLWAETYDRELTAENIFAIQSEIASAIAGTLHAKLLPDEKQRLDSIPTQNLEAYDAYLLARRDTESRHVDTMTRATDYYRRAIELDPDFALAYSGLAEALVLVAAWGGEEVERLSAEAEQAARRALELDPNLGEAHTAMGVVLQFRGRPPDEYVGFLERGVELAPGSADARKWYAGYLSESDRYEEAAFHMQKATELDPMSPIIRVNYAGALQALGRHEEAHAAVLRALEIDPTFPPALFSLIGDTGRVDALVDISTFWKQGKDDPWYQLNFFLKYLMLGDDTRAQQWLEHMDRTVPESVPWRIANLNLAMYRDDVDGVSKYAAQMLPFEQAEMPVPSRLLSQADLRAGHPEIARDRYAEMYPKLLSDDPEVEEDYPAAIDIALVLNASGASDEAARLLDRSLAFIDRLPQGQISEFGVYRARAQAMLGEREAALSTLEQTVAAGWRFQWHFFLQKDVAFDSIRDDPRFQAVLGNIRADVAKQLATVRALEASGDIVVPDGNPR